MFEKTQKIYKKVNNGIFPIKKVDKDTVGPINVTLGLYFFLYFRTNLGLTCVDHIFYDPNVANLRFRKIYSTRKLVKIQKSCKCKPRLHFRVGHAQNSKGGTVIIRIPE